MEVKKTLLLLDKDSDFFAKHSKHEKLEIAKIYRNMPRFLKILRNIHLKYYNDWYKYWFNNDWKQKVNNFDCVIIHAGKIKVPIVKYLNKYYPNIKVIFWYWNPVEKTIAVDKLKNLNCELWTFDPIDSRKYELKLNTQFYFNDIEFDFNNYSRDILFVGKDKGRYEKLIEFKNIFESLGLRCDFLIVSDSKFHLFDNKSKYDSPITYERIISLINESKAIFDFVSEGQSGLTLRPLEALFSKRKLITNDIHIRNYDFYNSNNIFILGIDDLVNINTFLKRPFDESVMPIIRKYTFQTWFERFFEI